MGNGVTNPELLQTAIQAHERAGALFQTFMESPPKDAATLYQTVKVLRNETRRSYQAMQELKNRVKEKLQNAENQKP